MTRGHTHWNVCNDACEGREVTVQSMWSLCMQRGRELSSPWHQERVSKHRLIMETDRNFPVRLYLIHSRLLLVLLPLLCISWFVYLHWFSRKITYYQLWPSSVTTKNLNQGVANSWEGIWVYLALFTGTEFEGTSELGVEGHPQVSLIRSRLRTTDLKEWSLES